MPVIEDWHARVALIKVPGFNKISKNVCKLELPNLCRLFGSNYIQQSHAGMDKGTLY